MSATSPDTAKLDTIREAEQLIRARAENAGPRRRWDWLAVGEHGYPQQVVAVGPATLIAETYTGPDAPGCDAEHIASWHPVVAFAVADSFHCFLAVHWPRAGSNWSSTHRDDEHDEGDPRCTEACINDYVICNGCGTSLCNEIQWLLPIARAYLGRDA